MTKAEAYPTRTLTIVLPESDWRALRDAEPDAIGWLHGCIRERLASPGAALSTSSATARSWTSDDEY